MKVRREELDHALKHDNQTKHNLHLKIMQDLTQIAQKQPESYIFFHAREHSYVGFNSPFRQAIMELTSKPDHYQIKEFTFYIKYPYFFEIFSKPHVKIQGLFVMWRSGKITMIRPPPGRWQHIQMGKKTWDKFIKRLSRKVKVEVMD